MEETTRLLEKKNQELEHLTEDASKRREGFRACDQKLRDVQMSLSRDELRLSAIAEDLRELRERRDATNRDADTRRTRIASAGAGHKQLHVKMTEARAATEGGGKRLSNFLRVSARRRKPCARTKGHWPKSRKNCPQSIGPSPRKNRVTKFCVSSTKKAKDWRKARKHY